MMRQVVVCLALLLFLGLTLGSENSFASSEEGKTISLAKQTIHNDNLVEAKKGAVFQAMRSAVQEAVVKIASKSVITEDLDLIYEKVLSDPEKYIVSYNIFADFSKQGQYMVAVEATVNTRALEEFFTRVNVLNSAKETTPSILFLISEQSVNEELPTCWWGEDHLSHESFADGAIVSLLEKKGYTIVGKASTRPDPAALGITFDFIHDSTAAIKLGTALKADMVIMGRAMAKEVANGLGDELSYKATIVLELFSTETGKMIASIDEDAVVPGIKGDDGARKALIMAGELAGETLVSKIQVVVPKTEAKVAEPKIQNQVVVPKTENKVAAPKIQDQGSSLDETVRPIETRFEGVDYLANFIMLRKVLKSTPGIEGVQTRELGTDKAVVEILFKGNAKKLADLLMVKTFETFSLETADVVEDSMVIRFVPKNVASPVAEPVVEPEIE